MIIYVASPYVLPALYKAEFIKHGINEDDFADVMRWRAQAALEATAALQYQAVTRKLHIFFYTPIGYEVTLLDRLEGVPRQRVDSVRNNGPYWMELDRKILSVVDGLVVLALPGWSASPGIAEEVEMMSHMIGADLSFLYHNQKIFTPANVRRINDALVRLDNQAPDVELPVYNSPSLLITHYLQQKRKHG